MASTISDGGAEAGRYRQAQRGLTRLLFRDVGRLRRLIIPSRLQATVPDWLASMNQVIAYYGDSSASLAAEFYDAQRAAAGVTEPFQVPLPDLPPVEQVDNSLRWATKDLWPRDPEDPETTDAQRQPIESRLEAAGKKAEAVAQKLVTDQGRGTVQGAVAKDHQATAWARSAALGACAFCRLLAARGAVFKQDTVEFRAHDGCHCMALPVFRGQRFELSPHAREWDRIYREYAAPYPGDQLRRFRRAIAEHG
ncbi:VG15 protein [Streptomyces nigrescens]